jgi:hypothetical protein
VLRLSRGRPSRLKIALQKPMVYEKSQLGLTPAQTAHLLDQLQIHFADAWVEGYDAFIPAMANRPKDRHVLATAVSFDNKPNSVGMGSIDGDTHQDSSGIRFTSLPAFSVEP